LADSFYLEGKYREAGVEFNKLRLQFPTSVLAPAGLLRQALCYKNLKQTTTYRTTLQKLVKAYPNSPEAKEAQKLLKEGPKETKTPKRAAR
jgi:TolA-binding protein